MVDQIMMGKRPEGMDFEEFKYLRSQTNKMTKHRLKGYMFHKSSWIEPIKDTKNYVKKTQTYIKPKEDGKI